MLKQIRADCMWLWCRHVYVHAEECVLLVLSFITSWSVMKGIVLLGHSHGDRSTDHQCLPGVPLPARPSGGAGTAQRPRSGEKAGVQGQRGYEGDLTCWTPCKWQWYTGDLLYHQDEVFRSMWIWWSWSCFWVCVGRQPVSLVSYHSDRKSESNNFQSCSPSQLAWGMQEWRVAWRQCHRLVVVLK